MLETMPARYVSWIHEEFVPGNYIIIVHMPYQEADSIVILHSDRTAQSLQFALHRSCISTSCLTRLFLGTESSDIPFAVCGEFRTGISLAPTIYTVRPLDLFNGHGVKEHSR